MNDTFRHSKWLSFIGEQGAPRPEAPQVEWRFGGHHRRARGQQPRRTLLRQLLPGTRVQMVTIVMNAGGTPQGGFYRVEEYAFFCFLGESKPIPIDDDLLADEFKAPKIPVWRSFNRFGGINVTAASANLVYPVLVDERGQGSLAREGASRIAGAPGAVSGDLNAWRPDPNEKYDDGIVALWPYKGDGSMATWEGNPSGLMSLVEDGFARVRGAGVPPTFTISYVKSGMRQKVKTGVVPTLGREPDGGPLILGEPERKVVPKTAAGGDRATMPGSGERGLSESCSARCPSTTPSRRTPCLTPCGRSSATSRMLSCSTSSRGPAPRCTPLPCSTRRTAVVVAPCS